MSKKAFSIHYNLKNAEGKTVDTSIGGPPLEFVEGDGSVVKGLEQALLERKAGDVIAVTVPPELAYGNLDQRLVYQVPVSRFDNLASLKPGMLAQAYGDEEHTTVVRIVEIGENEVLVDANHPLAGFTLYFEVEILSVEELSG
ncbi:MAG: peptidylprolyl isomerase [Gammaproteobacteria bacterium]|nr:MAG: peptidylprolyl isomerase [Gammaproteobacteria bacterium]